METPQQYREKAEKARRLAAVVSKATDTETLQHLAEEYERKANDLENRTLDGAPR